MAPSPPPPDGVPAASCPTHAGGHFVPPVPSGGALDTLAAEREWVRRVARALAGDGPDADDLEQQAWLAWLRRPPRAAGSGRPAAVRAWLRTVLTNERRVSGRGAARRRTREVAAARPEAQPSAADSVARAEAHRRVVDAVLALDEPWRTAVVLRYFEDLDPAEIGARTGAPADTVRARLRRAHEILRARLDPSGRGRDAPWSILLFPATPFADAAGAASPGAAQTLLHGTGARAAGSALMSGSKTKAVALLAVLAAVAGSAWIALSGDGGGGAAPHAELAGDGASSSRAAARDGTSAHRTTPADGPGAGRASGGHRGADAASWTGDVRTVVPDAPAAGAVVTLRRAPESGAQELVVDASADASGAFAFTDLPPGGPWTITASLAPHASAVRAGVRLAPGEARRMETLRLDAPVRGDVRVVGPDGTPVAGATVEAFTVRARIELQDWDAAPAAPSAVARTGADGGARFPSLSVGAWTFRASHPEFASVSSEPRTLTRGGVPLAVTIRLERGHPLSGTITGTDGRPVAGATVHALPVEEATALMVPRPTDARGHAAPTDAEGRYAFERLPAGDHSIALVRAGSLPCRLGNVSIPSVSRFDAKLDGGVISGRVTEEGTGRPLGGARVRAAVWRRHSPTFLSGVSGPDGRYRIDVPLGGALQGPARGEGEAQELPVHFDVDLEGYVFTLDGLAAPWRQHFVFGGQEVSIDVTLRPAAALEGAVTGPDGPVAGAEVTADVWNPLRGSIAKTAVSDAAGRYRFPGLPDGRARIVAAAPGFVQSPSPGTGWRAEPQPDPAWIVEIPRSGARRFDIALTAAVALRGRVVGPDGGGVPGANVTAATASVTTPPGIPTAGSAAALGARRRPVAVTTDGTGTFEIAAFPAGAAVSLSASAPGHGSATLDVTVPEPGAAGADVRLTLDVAPAITGRVASDASPLRDAWVQVAAAAAALDEGYEIVSVWETSPRHPVRADGSFDAPAPAAALAPGKPREVVVRAGASGMAPSVSGRIALAGSSADAGTIRLAPGAPLRGIVVAADGSGPIAGAEIEFQNERLPPAVAPRRDWSATGRGNTPFTFVARSGADGTFEIPDLPEWRYELRVGASGCAMASAVAPVPSDEPVRVELARLAPIGGVATFEDGAPAAGAIVVAHWVPPQSGVAGTAECASDGSFLFPLIPAGSYRLEARRAWDRAMDILPSMSEDIPGGTRDVKLVVRRGGARISGRCVTDSGAPVPGASLHARLATATGAFPIHARSGPDGAFAITSLEGGPWTIFADATRAVGSPRDFGRVLVAQADSVAAGASDVTLVFRAAAPVRGRLLAEDGKAPPPGFAVSAKPGADNPAAVTLVCPVAADGSFRFDNATAGAWTLAVTSRGAEVRVAGPAEVTGGTTDVRLTLPAATGIAGRVTDAAGRGVQGAAIHASRGETSLSAWTDGEGRFRIDGAEGPGWSVLAGEHGTGRSDDVPASGGDAALALVLRAQPLLEFTVLGESGAPLRGVRVAVLRADAAPGSPPEAIFDTDADGRVRTRALRDGSWSVELTPPAAGGAGTPLGTVRNGAPAELRAPR